MDVVIKVKIKNNRLKQYTKLSKKLIHIVIVTDTIRYDRKMIFKTFSAAINVFVWKLWSEGQRYYRGMLSLVCFSVMPKCIARFSLR